MLLAIPNLLDAASLEYMRDALDRAAWVDGARTAGHQSAQAKHNEQLDESDPLARDLGGRIVAALERHPLFISAALPSRVFPPLFNRYAGGQSFGNHVDNAIRQIPGTPLRVRTDLSATLFLNAPQEYDGGELIVEDLFGTHSVKLPAGDMILYPASSLHRVTPVTRGARLASFFWIQSMVRDDGERRTLLDLDLAIQHARNDAPASASIIELTNVYHNLLRRSATP